jgi:Family of unknown function (DUF6174)
VSLSRVFIRLLFLAPSVVLAEPTTLQQLESAEATWQRQAPASYSFSAVYDAMVLPRGCGRIFRVEVHNLRAVPVIGCRELRSSFSTVPMLFRAIREGLSQPNADVSATFNSELGYPTEFTVGDRGMIDAYFHVRISDFRTLAKSHAPN